MLARRATDHISELIEKDLFNGSSPSVDIVSTVLRICSRLSSLTRNWRHSLKVSTAFSVSTVVADMSIAPDRGYITKDNTDFIITRRHARIVVKMLWDRWWLGLTKATLNTYKGRLVPSLGTQPRHFLIPYASISACARNLFPSSCKLFSTMTLPPLHRADSHPITGSYG